MQDQLENSSNSSVFDFLVTQLKAWFPKLEGRVYPVTDIVEITGENVKAGPTCVVALKSERAKYSSKHVVQIRQEIIILIAIPVAPTQNEGEPIHYSFFDYYPYRNKIISGFATNKTPECSNLEIAELSVESTNAVHIVEVLATHEFNVVPEIEDVTQRIEEITFVLRTVAPNLNIQ